MRLRNKFSRVASALLNLSLGRRERGKEKKEGEKEKGREGEQVRARGATVPGLPSLRNLGSLGAPPLQTTAIMDSKGLSKIP